MGRKPKDHTQVVMKVYEYIVQRSDLDIIPTVREICEDLGIPSTSTAHKYINILCDMGLIEKHGSCNRAIKIANKSNISVPIVGTVAAGTPITAIENIDGYISFSNYNADPSELFALRVKGDSMINVAILDGDIVVIKKTRIADNGTIVVAMVDEEATVKTFYKENNYFRLQPENDDMDPIIVSNVDILGKVVGVTRIL